MPCWLAAQRNAVKPTFYGNCRRLIARQRPVSARSVYIAHDLTLGGPGNINPISHYLYLPHLIKEMTRTSERNRVGATDPQRLSESKALLSLALWFRQISIGRGLCVSNPGSQGVIGFSHVARQYILHYKFPFWSPAVPINRNNN